MINDPNRAPRRGEKAKEQHKKDPTKTRFAKKYHTYTLLDSRVSALVDLYNECSMNLIEHIKGIINGSNVIKIFLFENTV